MGKKFKYSDGDIINGVKLLRRLDKRHSCWYGLFECPYCGREFEAQIGHIQCGQIKSCGCIPVGVASKNYPKEKVFGDFIGQHFGKLTVIGRIGQKQGYSSRACYWKCLCECGRIVEVSTACLKNGQKSCGKCYRDYPYEDIQNKKFGLLTPIEYLCSIPYKGPIWLCKCECGGYIKVDAHSLKTGNTKSCGCLVSYGEKLIAQILDHLQIRYKRQKTFSTCINPATNKKLKFDFYLPDFNCCIEYDGIQHFKSSNNKKSWNTPERLEHTKELDKIKSNWCMMNNVRLIRIPYTKEKRISPEYLYNIIIKGGEA